MSGVEDFETVERADRELERGDSTLTHLGRDPALARMLARLERENTEGRETVSLTRAEGRAIYSLAFAGSQRGEDCDAKDRLQMIVTKMGPIGWPA